MVKLLSLSSLFVVFLLLPTANYPLLTIHAAPSLDKTNQKVCDRFEEDLNKMAAIMEEVRERKGIKETRVAFGGIDTPIKSADYWITYTAEAIAYQRVQKYSSKSELRYSLEVLRGKVLQARREAGKVLE